MAAACPSCQLENSPSSRYCAGCGHPLTSNAALPPSDPTQTLGRSPDFETGVLFAGRYQVIEKIGAGGMGRVFKAFDTKVRERIAIKIIKPELALDAGTIERFRSEIRLARRISHKNVCRVFDLGEYGGVTYITMELVPGESLKSIIRMTAPLSIPTALHYAREICEGLEEAHRWDIVHRDLKPQNIMVDPTGAVRIMDFGIARWTSEPGQTDPGIAVGTPEYMSPEQAEGKKTDRRTDIYAFGIVLYEMVTGKVPFEGDTMLSILRKHELERPRPPRDINPLVPERLNRLILKCLEKSEERRYQTAGQVLQGLQAIEAAAVKNIETKAGPIRARADVRPPGRLYRIVGWAAAIIVITAGGIVAIRHWIPGTQKASPPKPASVVEARKFIAVLPFDIKTPDANYANLGTDLAESIRTRLAVSGLRILSSYSSESLKNSRNRPAETQRANVGQYVQGALRVDGNDIRISVTFIDAASESIIWAKEFPEKLAGIYSETPDRISLEIARQLRSPLDRDQLRALRKHGTANLDAYIALVNGKAAVSRYGNTEQEEQFTEALALVRRAIDLDHDYPLAYRTLGDLYEARFVTTHEKSALDQMVAAFQKAYDLDPAVPGVHAGLGWAYFHQEKFDLAFEAFKAALAGNPDESSVNRDAGSFLRSIGLDSPALRHYELAIEADPLEPNSYFLAGTCYLSLGDFEKSEARLTQALALSPDNLVLRLWHIRLLVVTGRRREAEKGLDALESAGGLSAAIRESVRNRRALIAALDGNRERALSLVKACREPYRYEIANVYTVLGMTAEAVRNIKLGNENGFRLVKDYLYPYPYLTTNPFFKALADDPGFQAVVRNEKARFETKLKRYGDL